MGKRWGTKPAAKPTGAPSPDAAARPATPPGQPSAPSSNAPPAAKSAGRQNSDLWSLRRSAAPPPPPPAPKGKVQPPGGPAQASSAAPVAPLLPRKPPLSAEEQARKQEQERQQATEALKNANNFENGLISPKIQVIMVTGHTPAVAKLRELLGEDPEIKIHDIAVSWVPQLAKRLMPCMVIASLDDADEMVRLLAILRTHKDDVVERRIRFTVISRFNNPAIIQKFEDYGCHEFIVEPLPEKKLLFKVNLHTRALGALRKEVYDAQVERRRQQERQAALAAEEAVRAKASKEAEEEKKIDREAELLKNIRYLRPNETTWDHWAFRGNKPGRFAGKWMLRLSGPPSAEGDWVEMLSEEGGEGVRVWKFIDKGREVERDELDRVAGWEWRGDRPTTHGNIWIFHAAMPSLRYVDEKGKVLGYKLGVNSKGFLIASADSTAALRRIEFFEAREDMEKQQRREAARAARAEEERVRREAREEVEREHEIAMAEGRKRAEERRAAEAERRAAEAERRAAAREARKLDRERVMSVRDWNETLHKAADKEERAKEFKLRQLEAVAVKEKPHRELKEPPPWLQKRGGVEGEDAEADQPENVTVQRRKIITAPQGIVDALHGVWERKRLRPEDAEGEATGTEEWKAKEADETPAALEAGAPESGVWAPKSPVLRGESLEDSARNFLKKPATPVSEEEEKERKLGIRRVRKVKLDENVREYAPDTFGGPGNWEPLGVDPEDPQHRRLYVYVYNAIRTKEVTDVEAVPWWWLVRGERPVFSAERQAWLFRDNEPERIAGFERLPQIARDYLLLISPKELKKKQQKVEERRKLAKVEIERKIRQARALKDGEGPAVATEAPEPPVDLSSPTPLAMTVVLAELMMSQGERVTDMLGAFCKSFSDGMKGCAVSVIFLPTGGELQVLGSSHRRYVNTQLLGQVLAAKVPYFDEAGTGSLFCPVTVTSFTDDGNMREEALGALVVEPLGPLPVKLSNYMRAFSGIAQSLRGIVSDVAAARKARASDEEVA